MLMLLWFVLSEALIMHFKLKDALYEPYFGAFKFALLTQSC